MMRVTSPLLPPLEEFQALLADVWQRRHITNQGNFHQLLESELAAYLGVPYVSLFTNGTLPLIAALKVLGVAGEVITTPYSFVATAHAILWSGLKPVFVDVDPVCGNMDPDKIEAAITPRTCAIMPVHVYGIPCDVERIQSIAEHYGLPVVYDAAHAFGVRRHGQSILTAGTISSLSFHATKIYNTVEGGALVCRDDRIKHRIDRIRNFGFDGNDADIDLGINGKMDELRAAYGLLNLRQVDEAIAARRRVVELYRSALQGVQGLRLLEDIPGVTHNDSYFPVFIEAAEYGETRDTLWRRLREQGICARRYFSPLLSSLPLYRELPGALPFALPVATRLANEVLCLPLHHELRAEDVERVISVIRYNRG